MTDSNIIGIKSKAIPRPNPRAMLLATRGQNTQKIMINHNIVRLIPCLKKLWSDFDSPSRLKDRIGIYPKIKSNRITRITISC